ncbi:MAG: hypothetical protein ABJE79_14675 [Marinomonas sp.]
MTSFNDTMTSLLQNKEVIARHEIGVLKATGPDAKKFLQGQITCDINKLTQTDALYGAICSIKGRIITNFYLVQNNDDVLMLMSADLVEKILLHLKKYAVFFKAELSDESEHFHLYSRLTKASVESAPETLTEKLPAITNENGLNLTVSQCPITVQWLLTDSSYKIKEQNQELAALEMLSARPVINLEQSETMLPQWLNMQRTGGISFTKGCYTGQEIVARMQYRGKSKKQLALFQSETPMETNQDILDKEGKNVGQVIKAAALSNGYLAQAIINTDPSEIDGFLIDNQTINHLSLPYSIDSVN